MKSFYSYHQVITYSLGLQRPSPKGHKSTIALHFPAGLHAVFILDMMKNYVLLNCELWADSIGSCTSYYLRGTESTYNKSIDVHHQYIFDTETRKLYPSYEYPTWNILFVFRYP